jgi:predicted enzyme related to lactoylglutathione lyase
MSKRSDYPHGVPCWVETLQNDPQAAARFYGPLFGWSFAGPGTMPGDGGGDYLVAELQGSEVAGVAAMPVDYPGIAPQWFTHVRVQDAGEAAERAARAGGAVLAGPLTVAPAGRMAVIADPAGAVFCVWEPAARQGAQRVNEAGAWAMSLLTTPDPEGAESFYGELFGWETEDFGAVTLWRLPGYVGGEPQQPVSREVVAAMTAGAAPARWGVDFWVRDADAAASSARESGGRVLAEPHDVPGFRRAILADPHGADFSVSALVTGAAG